MKHSESQHGAALIDWHLLNQSRLPGLDLLFHVPNEGKRTPRAGARLKREGMKSGVLDYWLPVPIVRPHLIIFGLAFELKSDLSYPTPEQRWWCTELTKQGWFCFCAWDWERAAAVIEKYLLRSLEPSHVDGNNWLQIGGERVVKVYR